MQKSNKFKILLLIATCTLIGATMVISLGESIKENLKEALPLSLFLVPSDSMSPTIQKGDRIKMIKIEDLQQDLQRFDIIVFPSLSDSKKFLIRRIIALPEETIAIKDSMILINGLTINDPRTSEIFHFKWKSGQEPEVFVPKGHYFLGADNLNPNSWGIVPTETIQGKVVAIYSPLNRFREF